MGRESCRRASSPTTVLPFAPLHARIPKVARTFHAWSGSHRPPPGRPSIGRAEPWSSPTRRPLSRMRISVHTKRRRHPAHASENAALRPSEREHDRSPTTPGFVTEQALPNATERHAPGLHHRDRTARSLLAVPQPTRMLARGQRRHDPRDDVLVDGGARPRRSAMAGASEPTIALEIAAVLTPRRAASGLVPGIASALRRLSNGPSRASERRHTSERRTACLERRATRRQFRVRGSVRGRLVGALSEPPGPSRFPGEHLRSEGQGGGWR